MRPGSGALFAQEAHSRRSRSPIGLCVIGFTVGAVSVHAQDRAFDELPATVILPTITVEARSGTFDPTLEINSITVLDRDSLARSEERDVNGVFRGLPGVTLQTPGSRGTISSLFVRGASAGQGQLSFDGIPLYSSINGAFNLSAIPLDALERIEIVRGASAPRYGSRALGGVIRLESRDARDNAGFVHLEGRQLRHALRDARRISEGYAGPDHRHREPRRCLRGYQHCRCAKW